MVQLLDELDVNGTYHAVQNFLYDKYPVIRRKSGVWGDYSSPVIDGMPKAPSRGNGVERRMVEHGLYASALYAIRDAVKGCSHVSQVIITDRYFTNQETWKTKGKIGIMGNGSYMRRVKHACCEFADCIEPACEHYRVSEEMIPNLHKYQIGSKSGQ